MGHAIVRRWFLIAVTLLASVACALAQQGDGERRPSLMRLAHLEDPASVGVGRLVDDIKLRTLDGSSSTLSETLAKNKVVVVCATSVTCPLSARYADRIVALSQDVAAKGGILAFLNVTDTDSAEDMRAHVRDLGFKGMYLPDVDRSIRVALDVRTTTETFVIDSGRTLVYRGALDDQYGVGTALPAPKHTWLRDAIDAVLTKHAVEIGATWSPGCLVEKPLAMNAPATALTYHNRISRIIQDRCMECHRRGGTGPFPLETYQDVSGRATMIEAVLRDEIMPPWPASTTDVGGASPFANDHALGANERGDLLAWLASNRSMGEPREAPAPREFPHGWNIGQPDLLVMSGPIGVEPGAGLRHHHVVIDTGLAQATWISAVEVRSMGHGLLHHALVYAAPSDANIEEPPSDPAHNLLAMSGMGYETTVFPTDSAMLLPAHAKLVVEWYSQPTDRIRIDRVRVALRFLREKPMWKVTSDALIAKDLTIPAGDAAYKVVVERTLEDDCTIAALVPSMRARGHAVKYEAVLPRGQTRVLLDIPAYDYRWRPKYILREPVSLPSGTVLRGSAVFDNSANNPNNPDATKQATSGWDVDDEMLLGLFWVLEPVE